DEPWSHLGELVRLGMALLQEPAEMLDGAPKPLNRSGIMFGLGKIQKLAGEDRPIDLAHNGQGLAGGDLLLGPAQKLLRRLTVRASHLRIQQPPGIKLDIVNITDLADFSHRVSLKTQIGTAGIEGSLVCVVLNIVNLVLIKQTPEGLLFGPFLL